MAQSTATGLAIHPEQTHAVQEPWLWATCFLSSPGGTVELDILKYAQVLRSKVELICACGETRVSCRP